MQRQHPKNPRAARLVTTLAATLLLAGTPLASAQAHLVIEYQIMRELLQDVVEVGGEVVDVGNRIYINQRLPASSFVMLRVENPDVRFGGYFLGEATGQVIGFDYATGRTMDAGSPVFGDGCAGGDTSLSCGNCGYTSDWWEPSALYTYGRCASVDVTDPAVVTLRTDVRMMTTDVLEDWHATATVTYYQIDGAGQVHKLLTTTVYALDCAEHRVSLGAGPYAGAALCEGAPVYYAIPTTGRPLAADYYCVDVEIFNTRVPNSGSQAYANACAEVP